MPAPGVQPDPGAEQYPRDQRTEPGRQDNGVTQGILAHEDGGSPLRPGPGRLRTQPGSVAGLEEPSFHAEAG